MNHESNSTLVSLLQSLRDEITTLFRQEVALAKAEVTGQASRLGAHAFSIAIGALIGLAGAMVVLFGLADLVGVGLVNAGVSPEIAIWLSRFIVGAIVIGVGLVFVMKGKKGLSHDTLVPRQTLQSLQENKQWAETKLSSS